jgi:ATP-dependent helicase/nuclease subunit B
MTTSPTLNWLKQQLQQFVLNEKWLVCHKASIGQIWKDRANLSGTPSVNLHCKTISSIATSIAADSLCRNGITFLDRAKSIAVLQDILLNAINQGRLHYFKDLDHIDSLARLLQRTIHELRMSNVSLKRLSAQFIQPQAKAEDLRLIYSEFCDQLLRRQLADMATCIDLATEAIESRKFALPPSLVILRPRKLELSTKEEQLFELIARNSSLLSFDGSQEDIRSKITRQASENLKSFSYCSTQGEVNEVRRSAQQVLDGEAGQIILLDDVEFAYTDSSYAPLIYEFLTGAIERLCQAGVITEKDSTCPVTLSEGLPSVYSRPGRALRAWMRWMRTDFVQSKAVQMVREGLLQRPESTEEIGYARLASNLREISIGFDRYRFLVQIQSAIQQAELMQAEHEKQQLQKSDEPETNSDRTRDFGLPALRVLQAMLSSVLSVTPDLQDSPANILAKAKRFLLHCARCENTLDREARNKLLDAIDAKAQSLELATERSESILIWLEELPLETAILVSGPKPGCIHVSRITEAGFTGRQQVFVMGLDASRFPKLASVDPLLLDTDRQQISDALPTSLQRSNLDAQSLNELIERVLEEPDSSLHLSFSSFNLIEDRHLSPSPALVELFRLTQRNPQAHLEDLMNFIGPAVSFVGLERSEWLDNGEEFLASLLVTESFEHKQQSLEQRYPHFTLTKQGQLQRAQPEFTAFDGHVPQAGMDFDPAVADSRYSSSRLETFGTCPRKFFFRYGLKASPPDEWTSDPQRWLDPLIFGSLVHELFEEFLKELSEKDLVPNLKRDGQRLAELLHHKLRVVEQSYPCQNQDAKDRQIEQLESMCRIFLREEQKYCESTGARPWILEASFGIKGELRSELDCIEPIQLTLSDGSSIQCVGSPDRIDRVPSDGSTGYTVWDYKSGSDNRYSFDAPFQQGRKLQSFLYVHMLRHRLAATGLDEPHQISFGYFFPSPIAQGNRIKWSISELKQGEPILRAVCNTIRSGIFPATTNDEDCGYCEYVDVCGEPKLVVIESLLIASDPTNHTLMQDWRQLREIKDPEVKS